MIFTFAPTGLLGGENPIPDLLVVHFRCVKLGMGRMDRSNAEDLFSCV